MPPKPLQRTKSWDSKFLLAHINLRNEQYANGPSPGKVEQPESRQRGFSSKMGPLLDLGFPSKAAAKAASPRGSPRRAPYPTKMDARSRRHSFSVSSLAQRPSPDIFDIRKTSSPIPKIIEFEEDKVVSPSPATKPGCPEWVAEKIRSYTVDLPRQLEVLSKLKPSEAREPANLAKLKDSLSHLYQLDSLISRQYACFKSADANPPVRTSPNCSSVQECLVLWKSLAFTLPHQMRKLEEMTNAGYLGKLDADHLLALSAPESLQRFESMQKHGGELIRLMVVMTEVPAAVIAFKRGARVARGRRAAEEEARVAALSAPKMDLEKCAYRI